MRRVTFLRDARRTTSDPLAPLQKQVTYRAREPDPGENLEPTCLRDARVAASAGGRVYAPLPGKKR